MSFIGALERITVITGHFGSGKTNISLNIAFDLKKIYDNVTIVDFDLINPYIRTSDCTQLLEAVGINVIAPNFANTNVENFSLPPDIYSVFADKQSHVIFDVGGDDAGALALGGFKRFFDNEKYTMLYVINQKRPLIANPQDAADMLTSIESACRLKATGIINNTHLAELTDEAVVTGSFKYAEQVSKITGLPIVATAVEESALKTFKNSGDFYPIKIYTGKYE